MNKNLRRGVAVLATAFACLALMGSPASAATITADITAGTVTLINSTMTATDQIPLGPGVTELGTNCVNGITVNTTETLTGTTVTSVTHWQITGFTIVSRFKLSATWYVAELTRTGGNQGTVTGIVVPTTTTTGSATLNASTLTLAANIYTATNQSDAATTCEHGTTRTCRFASVALSVQGTYSGDIHSPLMSHTASLTGSGTLGTTTPPCNAPFTTYNAGTVTIAGLVAHVLTPA